MAGIYKNKILYGGTGSGSSVDVDTTLTQSGIAADAKVVGDRFNNIIKGINQSSPTEMAYYNHLKYDPETDYVYLDNSSAPGGCEWEKWEKAGLKPFWFYNSELEEPYLYNNIWGHFWWSSSYTAYADVPTIEGNYLKSNTISTSKSSATASFGPVEKIDLKPYKILYATVEWNGTINDMMLDIRNINDAAYIGVILRVGSGTTYIDLFVSSDLEVGANLISETYVSASTNTSRRTAIIHKLWLDTESLLPDGPTTDV